MEFDYEEEEEYTYLHYPIADGGGDGGIIGALGICLIMVILICAAGAFSKVSHTYLWLGIALRGDIAAHCVVVLMALTVWTKKLLLHSLQLPRTHMTQKVYAD